MNPEEIYEDLLAARKNARVRIFTLDDVHDIVKNHEKAMAWAKDHDLDPNEVTTHAVAGVVPRAYKYTPRADEIRITHGGVYTARRGYARYGQYGQGWKVITSIRVPAGTPAAAAAKAAGLNYHGGYVRWMW